MPTGPKCCAGTSSRRCGRTGATPTTGSTRTRTPTRSRSTFSTPSILAGYRPDEVGHDLWLTRQHHGAGYWDGDYREDHGETLTAYAQALGEATCYVPADGLAWIE